MKESIYIKHLGPLTAVEIDDIKPLMVLIGESASGKSTLMKVLSLMRYIYKMVNIRSYLKHSKITKSPFRLRFPKLLHDGLQGMFSKETVVRYTVQQGEHTYTLLYENSALRANILIAQEDLTFFKESYIAESRSVIPTWLMEKSSSRKSGLGFYFHQTLSDVEQAIDRMSEFSLEHLQAKMLVKRVNNMKKVYFSTAQSGVQDIELRYASSGIQSSAPIVAIATYFAQHFSFKEAFRRSVLDYLQEHEQLTKFSPAVEQKDMQPYVHIHIEEPELSLYPDAQLALMKQLVSILTSASKQEDEREIRLCLTTHSPYLLNILNVMLCESRKAEPADWAVPIERMSVYKIEAGRLENLIMKDTSSDEDIVDAFDLSVAMDRINQELDAYEE